MKLPEELLNGSHILYIIKYDPMRDDLVLFFPQTLRYKPDLLGLSSGREIWIVRERDINYGEYVSYNYYRRCRKGWPPERVPAFHHLQQELWQVPVNCVEAAFRVAHKYHVVANYNKERVIRNAG
jgi:hypothetical protein